MAVFSFFFFSFNLQFAICKPGSQIPDPWELGIKKGQLLSAATLNTYLNKFLRRERLTLNIKFEIFYNRIEYFCSGEFTFKCPTSVVALSSRFKVKTDIPVIKYFFGWAYPRNLFKVYWWIVRILW